MVGRVGERRVGLITPIEAATAPPVKLAPPIDPSSLRSIERQLHLRLQKWDTQVGDVSVLCEHPLVLPGGEWSRLCAAAETLFAETERLESFALETPHNLEAIGIPRGLREILRSLGKPTAANLARAMRFDFHPTASGWRVSEANTDVPGGWREGASLPQLYQPFYSSLDCPASPLDAWGRCIETLAAAAQVALLSAPGYLEDQQVLRTFRTELQSRGITSILIQTPAALDWTRAGCCGLAGSAAPVAAVIRFYQIEWVCALPAKTGWRQLLASEDIPVLNPTISAISESKRFPLLFREAGTCPGWQALMPECRDPREIAFAEFDSWVLKACYSNTGDRVLMVGDLGRSDRRQAIREAKRQPARWIAQRRFATIPLESCRGPLFPCVGVFVVGGHAAGAYVRLSPHQVTDGAALEAPLLIDRTDCL
jgi:glutathionylspermidine synthase